MTSMTSVQGPINLLEEVNRAAKIAKIIYTYLNTLKIILREKIIVLKTSMSAV